MVKKFLFMSLLVCGLAQASGTWSSYGGAPGGGHYSDLKHITPDNVSQLQKAWVFNTGDLSRGGNSVAKTTFEATPILFQQRLVFCTALNRIIAVDPVRGKQLWAFDPKLNAAHLKSGSAQGELICRGVAGWEDTQLDGEAPCKYRIFSGTQDGRLIAIDALNGQQCQDFGHKGEVDTNPDYDTLFSRARLSKLGVPATEVKRLQDLLKTKYGHTSPPAVIGDLVILGSAIADNRVTTMMHGLVRAYDARTGALKWTFDPIPKSLANKTGSANTWAPISVDPDKQLVFIATGSPSVDFYGGTRKEGVPYSDAIIALDANTGAVKWHFQTVHHDIFDYDLPAQPTLTTLNDTPVVIVPTKTGMIYVLNELTGKPMFPVEEVAVPQSDIPTEQSSKTQPRPTLPKPFFTKDLTEDDIWGLTPFDRYLCKRVYRKLRYEGMFTPPSEQGSLLFPMTGGGINWGGISYDPNSKLIIANYSRIAHIIKLIPRDKTPKTQISDAMFGTPYSLKRDLFLSPFGVPCTAPPWGMIAGIDLSTGKQVWERPYGAVKKGLLRSLKRWGAPSIGGSMVTQSGLIFIGASWDNRFRALDIKTGKTLWETSVPAIASSTPMSYEINGSQYVVVAAGGMLGAPPTQRGDALVAFKLPG